MKYSIGAKCFIAGLVVAGFVTAYALYLAV
ncbi:hypothetical protein PF621_gp56 [Salmonella phage vB_SenTO17]|uniref:Uncharacterized protein n=1 Tax=Salmonella phage vB_SenTO17 TaxID=2732254 RepID=A0A7G3T720_9CAUD|nr:hypothetical protein PF621_gp56 [Salmonella phage vB_SenTO17]QJQ80439.1 hypothetical protein vBSenTO17_56 [Salmonella phage vB_SenTO17]